MVSLSTATRMVATRVSERPRKRRKRSWDFSLVGVWTTLTSECTPSRLVLVWVVIAGSGGAVRKQNGVRMCNLKEELCWECYEI